MDNWESFEIKCTDYLNNMYGDFARFNRFGGSNSAVSDILVKTVSGNVFYMEVKCSPAQCGQFVLKPNLEMETFEYSNANKYPINKYSRKIINYMNDNFSIFSDVGKTGEDILMPNGIDVFSNWIIEIYKSKRIKFVITNRYIILPIENFKDYFDVSAKYRIKKSGSSNVGRESQNKILNYVNSEKYGISDYQLINDKLFVYSLCNLNNKKFFFQGKEYMFSEQDDNFFEIRRLSKTYNANVIFSIKLKDSVTGISPSMFIDYLKQ